MYSKLIVLNIPILIMLSYSNFTTTDCNSAHYWNYIVIGCVFLSIVAAKPSALISFIIVAPTLLLVLSVIYLNDRFFELKINFSGEVIERYRSNNHNASMVKLENGNVYKIPRALWEQVNIGDILMKEACKLPVVMEYRK